MRTSRRVARGLLVVSGLSLAAVVVACSAAPSSDAATGEEAVTGPDVSEPIAIEASAETTKAIGVVRWGVAIDGDQSVIRGYDAKGRVVTRVAQHLSTSGDTERHVEIEVSGQRGEAKMSVTVTGDLAAANAARSEEEAVELSFAFDENTFGDNEDAASVVEHLRADVDANGAQASAEIALPTETELGVRMGNAPGRGVPLTKTDGGGTCLNLTKNCALRVAETAYGIYDTVKECQLVLRNVVMVARCVGAGAAAGGPIGAAGAGLICSLVAGPSTVRALPRCALGITAAANGLPEAAKECTQSCRSGAEPAISTLTPAL